MPGPPLISAADMEAAPLRKPPAGHASHRGGGGAHNIALAVQQLCHQFHLVVGKPDFQVSWLGPFGVYAFLSLMFAYGFMQVPSLCVLLAVLAATASVFLVVIRHRGHVWLPLGVGCLVATIAGGTTGLFVYDQYSCFPAFYTNSRIYTNVVPSQPSLAVADAGKITFTSETSVGTNHSVGYVSETGRTYCIAPVGDQAETRLVQFWAVGVDCCGPLGDFVCDQAADSSALAGIRIFDNAGLFYDSNKDFYIKARRKAEAAYALVSAPEPMYVRWVREDNLDMLSNFYRDKAVSVLFFFFLVDIVVSAALAFAMYTPRKPGGARAFSG